MTNNTISINAGVLAESLSRIRASIAKRDALPILTHVMIDVKDTVVTLTGNNLESQLSIDIPAVSGIAFSVTASAQKLAEITSHMQDDKDVSLTDTGTCLVVKQGRSRYKLNTLPASDFPKIDAETLEGSFRVPERDLLALLHEVEPAMSVNDVRYYLNGALLTVNGSEVRTVATDGHRLSLSTINSGHGNVGSRSIILPRSVVELISRMLSTGTEDVEIGVSKNHIHLSKSGWSLVGKLIDGQFPSYEKVIPTSSAEPATMGRLAFRDLLQRALILAPEKSHGIRLTFDGNLLSVDVKDDEGEECQDGMPMNYNGPVVDIGVNGRYLLDALDTLGGDDVRVSLKDSNTALLIKGATDSTLCVVMPMRL
jgi:DNA polymerase-3 subunit beta